VYKFLDPVGWLFPALRRRGSSMEAATRIVEVPGHGEIVADACIDLIGANCLRTNLVTKRALDVAKAGAVVEIVSDNLSSVETIPFMLAGHNCVHLGTLHEDGRWRIYARKANGDEGGVAK